MKRIFIIVGIISLLIAIPLTVYLSRQQQDVRSRAQEVSPTPTPLCQVPPVVTSVKVEYPNCEGTQCSFVQANCSWDAITGVTSYAIEISQVESGEVVRSDSVNASTSRVVFSVVQDKTYQCDVSAVNSCGTGPAGTHSLLCSVQGVVATPTPAPTTVPVSTPIPTLVPTATPIPQAICGNICGTSIVCQAGLTCVQAGNGQSYCATLSFQEACKSSPSYNTCCTVSATPKPLPPIESPGDAKTSLIIGISGLTAIVIGGLIFLFAGL